MRDLYIIGGSTVESVYIRPSMKPHSCLEKILLEKGYSYSVFNQGVSGSQTQNIINVIINKIGNKQGSLVVLTLPTNDSTVLRLRDNYFSDHWRYASVVPAFNKDAPMIKNVSYDPYIRNLNIIIEVCKILQLKLLITSIVYTGINHNFKRLNEIAGNICKKNNVKFLDFEKHFEKRNDFFYDDVHFLPKGSQYYAKVIFDNIKDDLDTDGVEKINIHSICNDLVIEEKMVWSEYFNVSIMNSIKVIIDGEFPLDADSKQALLSVDYGMEKVNTSLIKSNNTDIGYFRYLTALAGKRMELEIGLEVPINCKRMRIGIRTWSSKKIKLHNAFVSIVKNDIIADMTNY